MADPIALPPRPWDPPPRPHRPPRPVLTREAIVEAALEIVETDGARGLTMRRVAERLGAAAASLYGHVANKEELIQLVLDRVFDEIGAPDAEGDWDEVVRAWLRRCRQVMRKHPGIAGLTLGRVPMGASSLLQMEAMLGIGRRAGLPDRELAYAGDLFGLYLGAFVHEEDMAAKTSGDRTAEEFSAMFRGWLQALPSEQFPNMIALAEAMTTGTTDDRFEWGLDVLMRGLASFIPPGKRRRRRPSQ